MSSFQPPFVAYSILGYVCGSHFRVSDVCKAWGRVVVAFHLQRKHRVLTTGLPGKSLKPSFKAEVNTDA